jgi:hypothetical protein
MRGVDMIEYTYLEIVLFCAFVVVLGYAFKYREESVSAKSFIRAMLKDRAMYDRVKEDHDSFMEGLKS